MENKTCLKPPTRTYILKKINVESTKVHKVVKLEKSVGFVQQTLTVSTFITEKISLR